MLAIARKVRNLSQREICKRLGQPPSFLGKIEAGLRGISVVEFVTICRAIGTDPRRILKRFLKKWPDTSAQDQPPTESPGQELA
ncbi:MAG: helix-turn-helix domain-containing protein [Thermoguttaceae bacterium]